MRNFKRARDNTKRADFFHNIGLFHGGGDKSDTNGCNLGGLVLTGVQYTLYLKWMRFSDRLGEQLRVLKERAMRTQGMRIFTIGIVTALTLQCVAQGAIADAGALDSRSPGGDSGGVEEVEVMSDEFGEVESAPLEVSDPIERVNRGVFWLNDTLDVYLLEPVAKGYDALVPDIIQEDLAHFFDTLRFPIYLFSDLIALDGERAWIDTARFTVNSTIGFFGFFDVAHDFGLERRATDAGVAFGRWGIPEGPYVVLPILGPSNLRDTAGEVFNFFLDPLAAVQFSEMTWRTKTVISSGAGTGRVINRRSQMIPNVRSAKEASLDYYLFVQSAYTQYRRGLVAGEKSADRALFDTRIDD